MLAPGTQIIVSDTCVLVNFLRIDRMDLIAAVSFAFLVTDHVTAEIIDGYEEQYDRFQAALDTCVITQIALSDPDELETFSRLTESQRLGVGECSAIACAACNGHALAIDDRRAIREARGTKDDLAIVRTQDLMVGMIVEELLTVEEADAIKNDWADNHRFQLTFDSFAELLPRTG